jgi:hypothetical protein
LACFDARSKEPCRQEVVDEFHGGFFRWRCAQHGQ